MKWLQSHRMFLKVVVYLLCQHLLHFRVQCQKVGCVSQSTGSGLMSSQSQKNGVSCDMTNLKEVQIGSSTSICHLLKYAFGLWGGNKYWNNMWKSWNIFSCMSLPNSLQVALLVKRQVQCVTFSCSCIPFGSGDSCGTSWRIDFTRLRMPLPNAVKRFMTNGSIRYSTTQDIAATGKLELENVYYRVWPQ